MREPFVPKNFLPPTRVDLSGEYYVVPITINNVDEDWKVITTNADAISLTRGAGSRSQWPYTCTLEENYKDLAWLEVCAAYKQLFCYILRRQDTKAYVGAIYIYPIALFYAEKGKEYDVDFSCWVVQSELDNGNYNKIFDLLCKWLIKDWPFQKERIYLRNKLLPTKYQK